MTAHIANSASTAKFSPAFSSDYVEDPNIPEVSNGALHGLLEALDSDSSYLSPDEYKLYKQIGQPAAGIDAAVSKRFGYGDVISVIPGGPADKAGLLAGDIVEALNDKSTREMSVAELDALLRGQVGLCRHTQCRAPYQGPAAKNFHYPRSGEIPLGLLQDAG